MIKRILTLTLAIFSLSLFLVFLSSQQINKTKDISASVVASVGANSSTASGTVVPKAKTLSVSFLSRDLSLNLKGDDVELLQTWLAKDGSLTALPNGYFGPATQKAVQAYQIKNGILILNKPTKGAKQVFPVGYGSVGAITRASLNTQFGNKMDGVSWVLGKYGAGVSLNGGYVEIPSTPELNLTYKDDVILDAWINPSILLKTKEMIFARGNHYGLGITDGGKIFVRQNGIDVISTKKYIKTNEWQHISATFSSGKIVFKYNEKQVEVKKFKAKIITPGSDSLLVGLSSDSKKGLSEAYIGAVDNIYIYTTPNKELAPLPQMRLNLDDAQGTETTSMTGIFHGNLKVAIFDSQLLKTKIPETKVPELAPVKTTTTPESPFPKVVDQVIVAVQNVVQQYTGISMGGGGGGGGSTPAVEVPAPVFNNGTPPDPNYPMPPHGQEVVYDGSAGPGTIVTFPTVDINPLVVYPGDTQTLKVVVTSTAGTISSVQSVTQLDTSIKTLNFVNDGTGTNTWTASWTVNDTHVNIYKTTFTAIDSAGNSGSVPFYWSDPCSGLLNSGNSALSAPCTLSVVDGVDAGNITLNTGTNLTLNTGATFVLTTGYSMTKVGNSYVYIPRNSGATMKKGYIFYAASGSYATGGTKYYFSTPSYTGYVRVGSSAGFRCDGGTIDPGGTRTRYNVTTPCSGSTACASEVQTCQTSGSWNGSYASTSCTASTRAGFTTSSPSPCGTACSAVAQTQTCQPNGTWSGSGITSCAVVSCCVPTYNNLCYGPANACGDSTAGTILCGGGCSVVSAPACDCYAQCETWNSCGTAYNIGSTNACGAGCNAGAPANPGAQVCDGPANACGNSNPGYTDVCGQGCSATTAPAVPGAIACSECSMCGCNYGTTDTCQNGCSVSAPTDPGVQACEACNSCGTACNAGSTDACGEGCSASAPANPGVQSCEACSSCGCNYGVTNSCGEGCSVGAPSVPWNLDAQCNACGNIQCDGSCSVGSPSQCCPDGQIYC